MKENNFIIHNIYFILDYLLHKSRMPFYDQVLTNDILKMGVFFSWTNESKILPPSYFLTLFIVQ